MTATVPSTATPILKQRAEVLRRVIKDELDPEFVELAHFGIFFALAMDQTKRFQSVDPSHVSEILLNSKTRSEELLVRPDRAVALGKPLEVTGWLVPVLLERRGVTYLDVTWVSAVTGTALFSRRMAITRADGAGEQRFPWEPRPED